MDSMIGRIESELVDIDNMLSTPGLSERDYSELRKSEKISKEQLRVLYQVREQYLDDVYTTTELQELFQVHSFLAPFVLVTEKATGNKGTLEFIHNPRVYFNFIEDK